MVEKYNLRLSKGKCALLKGEGEGRVRFTDGKLVQCKSNENTCSSSPLPSPLPFSPLTSLQISVVRPPASK